MRPHKEIKVLYVTNNRGLYGANNSMLQMAIELREKGVIPTVMMPTVPKETGNDLAPELERHGIAYIETGIRNEKHDDWKKTMPNYLLALHYRKAALKATEGMGFDLVHSNSSAISIGEWLAKKMGVPHVWHLREFGDLDYGLKTPFGKWYQKILYGGRNTFIAISRQIQKHYAPYVGDQEIRLIYNGIKPSPRRGGDVHERVEICIVGLLRKEKGQLDLLMAADELANVRGIRNFHISVIGNGDDTYEEHLKDYIREHRLSETVSMAGRRNDVSELLTRMDIGVMASSHEAFGRTTVEYMMAGLAVVASDGGANKEIIDDGATGLIYRSGDALDLADRLERLIKNPELSARLARQGQKKAEACFSSRANSDEVYKLYTDILKK